MTLDEYEKIVRERRKSMQKREERKVQPDSELKAMQVVDRKSEDDVFIKPGSDKDKLKKKDSFEKDEKSEKINNINERQWFPPCSNFCAHPPGAVRGNGQYTHESRGWYVYLPTPEERFPSDTFLEETSMTPVEIAHVKHTIATRPDSVAANTGYPDWVLRPAICAYQVVQEVQEMNLAWILGEYYDIGGGDWSKVSECASMSIHDWCPGVKFTSKVPLEPVKVSVKPVEAQMVLAREAAGVKFTSKVPLEPVKVSVKPVEAQVVLSRESLPS